MKKSFKIEALQSELMLETKKKKRKATIAC